MKVQCPLLHARLLGVSTWTFLTSTAPFGRCPSRMTTLLTTGTVWVLLPASPTAESQGHAVGAQKPPKE